MVVAQDILFLIPVGETEATNLLMGSSGAGSIQGQPDEAAIVERPRGAWPDGWW